MVAEPVPAALAASPTTQAPVAEVSGQTERGAVTEETETFDGSAHDVQLAETGAPPTLLLALGGLVSVGAGLIAGWVSRRSRPRH